VSGASLTLLFNAPFALVSKAEQLHLVAAGAVLMLAAGGAALAHAASARPARSALAAIVFGAAATFAVVARDISRDFDPFGPIVLAHDAIVREWAAVPEEIRIYLARKLTDGRRLSANPAEALDTVLFGVYVRETDPSGVPYYWMSRQNADIFVNARVRRLDVPLRHAIEAFREPVRARVTVDGRLADDVVFGTPAWRTLVVNLRDSDALGIGRMHRLRISLDRDWRPSELFPGSQDTRVLGLQIGSLVAR
jgi:hypothetical protein